MNKTQKIALLLIIWNLVDIAVHIAINLPETYRIAGNVIGIVAGTVVLLNVLKQYTRFIAIGSLIGVFILNFIHAYLHTALIPSFVFIGPAFFLLILLAQTNATESDKKKIYNRWWSGLLLTTLLLLLLSVNGISLLPEGDIIDQTFDGELIEADYWGDEPKILSAGMGFEGIIGIPEITESEVRRVGGSWYGSLTCTNGEEPPATSRTSAPTIQSVTVGGKGTGEGIDGLPVVFSWPVATETVDASDFKFTLNTGETVFTDIVTMIPNWELNERNVVVFFADFGNRTPSSDPEARFPVKLEIVEDETPLLLIGPGGQEFNAVGLTWETDSTPYDSGPRLVGAKINTIEDEVKGESDVAALNRMTGAFPNDVLSLYDEGDFKIRVLTTGGFSPDGVTGVRPDMFEDFFKVHAIGEDGETVLIERVGEEYEVAGGTLRVVGLSELGQRENPEEGIYYDDCYQEDRDNYIDIVLVGDREAAENITYVEIPSLEGGYSAFYNPGGPGPEPFEGVTYTAPGPPDLEPVIIDLENEMRVSRSAP